MINATRPCIEGIPTRRSSGTGRTVAALSSLLIAGFLLAGCGSSSKSASSSTKTVQVRLLEFQLTPSAADSKAGKVGFNVHNIGTTKHEMVVVRADSIDQLPRKPDGSVDEDKIPEADKAGETGEFTQNTTKELTLNLKPGNYIMFCNIVQNTPTGPVSHFARGMHTQFSVS